MADKLTINDNAASLEKRFENALKRFGHDSDARAAVLRRQDITIALEKKLEQRLGASIESIIGENEK
jgi:hypothetical protein